MEEEQEILVCSTWCTRNTEVKGANKGSCTECKAVIAINDSSFPLIEKKRNLIILCISCASKSAEECKQRGEDIITGWAHEIEIEE